MPWETNKPNGDPDEPDSPDEECVRMQNGKDRVQNRLPEQNLRFRIS